MVTGYSYELWNGKEVLGHYNSLSPIRGQHLRTLETSTFKQSYFSKPKYIEIPVITRVVSDNGIDVVIRRCLDIRHKSKRQIEILKGGTKL